MATEVEELLGFLSAPSPQLKKSAVHILRGLTGSDEGVKSLTNYSDIMLPPLFRLLVDKKEFAEPAAEAFVNLSQNSDLAAKMVEGGIVKGVMKLLDTKDCSIKKLLVMLLINLTHSEAGIASLLQVEDGESHGLYVMKLVRSFCTSSYDRNGDPFEHVGSILVNVSQKEEGRKILLDPKHGLFKQIIRQFDTTSSVRKKGVAGTIRNCCFEAESQLQNLLLTSEFLWPALLLLVAGSKVYSEEETSKMSLELASALSIQREAEEDPEIRIQTLEAIYMILLQEAGRRAFWTVNGPHILEIGYEDEQDPKVMEAYERVGSLLVHGNSEEDASTEPSN